MTEGNSNKTVLFDDLMRLYMPWIAGLVYVVYSVIFTKSKSL